MASPHTSLTEMFASHGAHAAATTGAVTAVAAAQNNTRVATAETRLAALTAAAAAKNNSMVAAEKNKTAAFDAMMAAIEQKQGQMWVIKDFDKLEGKVVGSGKCPGIVQSHGGLPLVKAWFEGPKVRGLSVTPYGTAVATFVNGRYPNWETGNHVAIYIDQHPAKGVLVFDQWTGEPAGYRWMKFGDGVSDRSNDGAALSIILTRKAN
ncbi:MAG: BPSL0067 family protein [Dongiaceae bacterium]